MKILITGSTSGIGFITGISLYDRGHEVIMTTHTEMECEILRKKLKNMKLGIVVLKLDITDKKDIDKIDFSTINVLINHAGIGIGGSIIDLNIEDVKKNFEVNLFSTLELSKKFLKARINKKERSKLIITSSIAGVIPINFLGSYCSTKASLIMICKCLKKELACIDSNIQVSLIEPGVYNTGFNEVMIDKAECSMTNDSVFFYEKEEI
ncbi:MAG: SDR family NAD(P)-dependent oxidoreductase, partial [bacterium]|nr:SDR family NAD(P)-dependent oxidoreductase [bacterium]